MGFEWSYHGLAQAYAAGIQEYEVHQALRGSWPRPMLLDPGLPSLVFWGRTDAGRALLVATRRLPGTRWDWEIVDARELTAAEDAELARWEDGR